MRELADTLELASMRRPSQIISYPPCFFPKKLTFMHAKHRQVSPFVDGKQGDFHVPTFVDWCHITNPQTYMWEMKYPQSHRIHVCYIW